MLWQGAKWRILKNFNVQNEECHNYALRHAHNNALEDNFFQNLNKKFKSMAWSIAHYAFNNIVILNK